MDSLERFMRAAPLPPGLPITQGHRRALVHASLASAVGRKGKHLTGTFCLTGDTMEGIIQCLVFLKAFSVSFIQQFVDSADFYRILWNVRKTNQKL